MAKWPSKIDLDYSEDSTIFHVDALKVMFTDFARTNLYKIEFGFHEQIAQKYSFMAEYNRLKTELMAKSVDIPQFDIGRQELKRMGQRIFLPASQSYGDMQVSFVCDDKYTQRKFLHSWLKHVVYDTDNNTYASVTTMADVTMTIYQFDNHYNTIFAAKFWAVWPSSIGNIQLGYENDSAIVEFPVTFSYSTYEILTPDTDKV